jgi:hypothetical protein
MIRPAMGGGQIPPTFGPRIRRGAFDFGAVPRIWDTYESAGRVIGGTHDLAFYDPAKRKFIDSDGGRTIEERIAQDDFEYLMRRVRA